jgi:hypothetical protein
MPKQATTWTVTTAAATFNAPDRGTAQRLSIFNTGTALAWIRLDASAAVAGADENIAIPAGVSTEIPYQSQVSAIAVGATTQLNVWARA